MATAAFRCAPKKLLDALRDDAITLGEDNEDEAICIRHREPLESKHGIVFANERVADRFAFDVSRPNGPTLGFHGVFNFWQVLSDEELSPSRAPRRRPLPRAWASVRCAAIWSI